MAGTGIDTTVPHSARIWNYWLGGKDNYPVDRAAGDAWIALNPRSPWWPAPPGRSSTGASATSPARRASGSSSTSAPACRPPTTPTRSPSGSRRTPGWSTSTTTRWCWPTPAPCWSAPPRARPATSTPTCASRRACWPARREMLDFDRPVALMFMQVLGHIADLDEARSLVRDHVRAAVPGQLPDPQRGLQHGRRGLGQEGPGRVQRHRCGALHHPHARTEIESLFPTENVEWVEPGFVSVPFWRPEPDSGRVHASVSRRPSRWTPTGAWSGRSDRPRLCHGER